MSDPALVNDWVPTKSDGGAICHEPPAWTRAAGSPAPKSKGRSKCLITPSSSHSLELMEGAIPSISDLSSDRPKLSPTERVRHKAREEGFAEGHAAGMIVGIEHGREQALSEAGVALKAELARVAAELDLMGVAVGEAMARWYQESEESLALLSVEIAQRLVARELELSPDVIMSIAKEALAEVTHSATATVRVDPFHSGVLERYRDELMSAAQSIKHIEIVADSAILSGCVVETEGGVVDAAIKSKIRNLLAAAGEAT